MRSEKQTSKDFYKHRETGEIFCIERRWDGVLIGSCGPLAWMVIDLALSTGLRTSEMAALKMKDIDLKREAIAVHLLRKLGHASPATTADRLL